MDQQTKQAGIDWLKILCVSGLFTVALFAWLTANNKPGRMPTLLNADGRRVARCFLYDNYPGFAKAIGIRSR